MKQFTLTVMMYHYVRDPGDAADNGSGIPGLPVSTFEAQLDYLGANFEMIAWPDLRACLDGARGLPSQACLLTFDDGVRDHYLNVFSVLIARRLSGLFFALGRHPGMGLTLGHKIHFLIARLGFQSLRSAFCDRLDLAQQVAFARADARYRGLQRLDSDSGEIEVFKLTLQRDLSGMADPILSQLIVEAVGPEAEIAREFFLNRKQVIEMAGGGMHFGGHSQSHPWLDWIDDGRLAQEIEASGRWLSNIEEGPWAFAYPYGGLDARSPAFLRANGFLGAFTTVPQAVHTDPLLIGRFDAESFSPERITGLDVGGES
jgi:peptidoglycan/xylan/chitin deacetylase (PgdA/CDA1 family)